MRAKRAFATLATALAVILGLPTSARAAVTIVHPDQLSGWEVVNSGVGASGTFVLGPATPPAGKGSFRQRANKTEVQRLQTAGANGTPLAGIQLAFSTWTTNLDPIHVTSYMVLDVDTNGDGTGDETLTFEPYEQRYYGGPATAPNAWQAWDADQSLWWGPAGGGVHGTRFTLADYLAMPGRAGARLATDRPALSMRVGSADVSWPAVDANVDTVTVNGTTYDFEAIALIVDCDESGDDIAAVQAAVDGASNGYTIKLKGTCDFSTAEAHGGDIVSIESAAVVVRRGAPVDGLTITSDGAAQSASVVGSGTQTAFFVAPGNANVTITGLRLLNLARPIVVANTSGTTIGSDTGQVPSPNANRIIGGSTMNSAILATAVDRGFGDAPGVYTVRHGAGSSFETQFSIPASSGLTGFAAVGNYISFDPPGAPDPSGSVSDVVGIDVRQRFARVADGVRVERNAVGMFGSEFPSINMNGVKLHALTPFSGTISTPDASQYYIRNVFVRANNLGRLEELGGSPGDIHASGRLGISLLGVANFDVSGNGVRARLSPTGVPMPGGGIVASDSAFGRIDGNGVIVVADPSTLEADLGAIGVVDDLNTAFAQSGKPQKSARITVTNNVVGPVASDTPGLGAQRGLVVNGSSDVVAHGNTFKFTSDDAINVAVVVKGPGNASSPGVVEIPKTATNNVVCKNMTDGATDNPEEASSSGSGTGNAFPGGSAFASNTDCAPTVTLSPGTVLSGASLVASGKGWATRTVGVTVTDEENNSITGSATAGADGSYTVTFSPATVAATLKNGTITAVATVAAPPTPLTMASAPATATLLIDTTPPAPPVILTPAQGSLQPEYPTVSGTTEPSATVEIRKGATIVGSATADAGGNWSLLIRFADGPQQIQARATDVAGNVGAYGTVRGFTVDAIMPVVRFTSPLGPGLYAPGSPASLEGTATDDRGVGSILLHFWDLKGRVVGQADAACTGCGGTSATWTATAPALTPGTYLVRAYATDVAGNRTSIETRIVRL